MNNTKQEIEIPIISSFKTDNEILIVNQTECKHPRSDFQAKFQNKLNSSLERLNRKLKNVCYSIKNIGSQRTKSTWAETSGFSKQ